MLKINWKILAELGCWLFILVALLWAITPPIVSAADLQYYQEAPQNNPLTLSVMQGDTIYLGKTYDLSRVTGISSQYAWWSDWKRANTDCSPTKIIDIRYYKSRINKTAAYLDPVQWTTGDWYYWDAGDCNLTIYDRMLNTTVAVNKPLPNDNKLAFFVVNPKIPIVDPKNKPSLFAPMLGYVSAYQ